jgi:hypothetical protein
VAALGILKLTVQAQGEHPQRGETVIDLPGGVEGFDLTQLPRLVLDGAIGERENRSGEGIALGEGDVGVVVGEVRAEVGGQAEDLGEEGRDAHAHLEHFDVAVEEEIPPFDPAQVRRGAAGAQHLAQRV